MMNRQVDSSPTARRAAARDAVDALGGDRDDRALLRVRCGRSHHVAAVFDTAVGPVFESVVGPHAHGDRDFIDTAHRGTQKGTRFVDVLDAGRFEDDLVPATCECGTHELSRAELQRAITGKLRTLLLT